MSHLRIVKKAFRVPGCSMKGRQVVGMFVLEGSSRVSFSKIAVKSNTRAFSQIVRV